METEKLAAVILCSIAVFGIMIMYFLNATLRRYNVRITGTSLEGARNSFLMQYPKDILLVKQSPLTPQTFFVIRYYDKTGSVESVERYY